MERDQRKQSGPSAIVACTLAFGACAVVIASACNDGNHTFIGRRWNAASQCLDPGTPLETVPGPSAGEDCDAACLATPNGNAVFATTMCPPFPSYMDTSETASDCAAAKQAVTTDDGCLPSADGGADGDDDDDAASDGGDDDDDASDASDGGDGDDDDDASDAAG
jgi:hypothetical protein